jgi:membrane-associated phospholipid phosphatase
MSAVAECLGWHPVAFLFATSIVLLLVTGLSWYAIERCREPLWRAVERLWDIFAASPLARALRRVPWLRQLSSGTVTVWRYLGLHAIVSVAVALAALAAFIDLADVVDERDDLALFDERLAEALRTHVGDATLRVFAVLTQLGDRGVTTAIGAIVALFFLLRRWWLHAAVWVLGTAGGGLLVLLLKSHFERTRPIHDHSLVDANGWSFPSGHASGAIFVYGLLGYFVIRHTPRAWHIPIALVTLTLVTFVGFSRVILQVHYLSDVLAGFAVGGAWIAVCSSAFEVIRRRDLHEGHLANGAPRDASQS